MMRVEAYRQLRRVRTWLAFGALAALPTIVAIANRLDRVRGESGVSPLYGFATASGINHALASLLFMSPFFLVVVVASFAGESVAGEANWGTLRALLTRPVTRVRLLATKLAVASALALAATAAVVAAGLASGTLAFGWHDIRVFAFTIPGSEGLARLLLAMVYVWWTTLAIVAFAFFLSTLTDAPAGAIGGAIGLAVASQIMDGIRSLRVIHPVLPTHYWSAWTSLFVPFQTTDDMRRGVVLAALWITVFVALAFWHFRRKDILS